MADRWGAWHGVVRVEMEALQDVRVIDFSRLAPGPMAAMILADLGADVVKVEEPGGGRRIRDERELKKSSDADEHRWRTLSPLERNKRSIAVNLREPAGREIAFRLMQRSDVVIEGYRPGVMRRLGLDYDAIRTRNPRLVYCSISGYGQEGPRALSVGHDLNYLAYSGALSLIGTPDGRPVVPINLLADYAGGSLVAVVGILAALIARSTSGRGQFIDVSMADSVVGLLSMEIARLLHTGRTPRAGSTYLTGGMAYYNVYETKDGRFLTVACNEPHFFRALCTALDLEPLSTLQFVESAQGQIADVLAQRFREKTLAEWVGQLDDSLIPIAAVRSLDEVLADPDLRRRRVIVQIGGDGQPSATQVGSPIHLSRTPVQMGWPAPLPGQDTEAIMKELGYDEAIIAQLAHAGVVVPLASRDVVYEEPERAHKGKGHRHPVRKLHQPRGDDGGHTQHGRA